MEIKLEVLKIIIDYLLTGLKSKGIESVPLAIDYYWHVPTEELFDPYITPTKLDIGLVSDDLAYLLQCVDEKREVFQTDLINLSAIIRALGETDNLKNL